MCDDNVSTKLPYFGCNFDASIMHAVRAVINLLQESVAEGTLLMFSDFFVHKPLWTCGLMDNWILLPKYCYNLENASREISKK